MATTKIWPVSEHLLRAIQYVMNPDKTDGGKLVSCVNAILESPEEIEKQFWNTKRRFSKTKGRLAYHMEQSFKPGEVTPELAHQIGVELAEQLYGDRFEVVVSTHIDKEHIHNHFVLNSVSFVDGLKYHEPNSEYSYIQKISDRLCERYGLSVVREPKKGRYKAYPEMERITEISQKNQPRHPTVHTMIYDDIDNALVTATDMNSFYRNLEQMGYRVKRDGKYVAIAPEGHKFFRMYKFAAGYTDADIARRLEEKTQFKPPVQRAPSYQVTEAPPTRSSSSPPLYYTYNGRWKTERQIVLCLARFTGYLMRHRSCWGLRSCYLQYRFILRSVQRVTYPKYPSIELRKEVAQLNRYSQQTLILSRNKIDTLTQLEGYMDDLDQRIHELNTERWHLKRELKEAVTDEQRRALQKDIDAITEKVRPMNREMALCKEIKENGAKVERRVAQEREAVIHDRRTEQVIRSDL